MSKSNNTLRNVVGESTPPPSLHPAGSVWIIVQVDQITLSDMDIPPAYDNALAADQECDRLQAAETDSFTYHVKRLSVQRLVVPPHRMPESALCPKCGERGKKLYAFKGKCRWIQVYHGCGCENKTFSLDCVLRHNACMSEPRTKDV